MKLNTVKPLTFLMFLLSGFAGLLYQVIWMRLAYASFGVIAPVLSVVISVFMLGLAVGSWAGGRYAASLLKSGKSAAALLSSYGLIEALIGIGALCVPAEYNWTANLILPAGELNSTSYLLCSALAIMLSIGPWCALMGATFPFMMAFIKRIDDQSTRTFSFLYLANVLGAIAGVSLTTFVLIELLGFRQTLMVGAGASFTVAAISFSTALAVRLLANSKTATDEQSKTLETAELMPKNAKESLSSESINSKQVIFGLLFLTGFISMAMEVVWTRSYAPVLGNEVYSFAGLLVSYLLATFVGSAAYRRDLAQNKTVPLLRLVIWLGAFALLPVIINDPRVHIFAGAMVAALSQASGTPQFALICKSAGVSITLLSIVPFSAALGYLTPQLIDEASEGKPGIAGSAYALNIVGCIIGPLFASYFLLAYFGTKNSLLLLSIPSLLVGLYLLSQSQRRTALFATSIFYLALTCIGLFLCLGYDDFMCTMHQRYALKRDYTATVLACDSGHASNLLVNGIGVTALNQCTKDMAHLPMLCHSGHPTKALTICFGMGTTFRSLLTWGLNATAVELVPSVRDLFPYFWPDANEIMKNPQGKVIVDDGRRFLKRSREKYDLIVVDCPPPVEAAGVSLLMSKEFAQLVKEHLNPDGIFLSNIIASDTSSAKAAVRAIQSQFAYTTVIYNPSSGLQCMACQSHPLTWKSPEQAALLMPTRAQADLFEWQDAEQSKKPLKERLALYLQDKQNSLVPLSAFQDADASSIITDDHPLNEYFLLRKSIKPSAARQDQSLFYNKQAMQAKQ